MNNKIKITSLASSSKGNAYHIKCNNTEILIDVGIAAKYICQRLNEIGTDISNIQAIFITHEHTDHIKGLEVLSKKHPLPIHIPKKSLEKYAQKHICPSCVIEHDQDFTVRINDITVKSFFSSHDSADCVGYIIESDDDKFGLATDLGYVDKSAVECMKNCNSVVIESNYDEKMLMNGSYPPELKVRIKSSQGHLSNYDCAAFARYLAENGTKYFMLAHLSEENNTPEIALNITSRALKDFDDVIIKVASVNTPTELI